MKDDHIYHTFEFDGEVIHGIFDLREIITKLPIPDINGKRVLDIGAADGWWPIEFAKRGAREIITIDINDNTNFIPMVDRSGFKDIKRKFINVYDITPKKIGKFDFCYCGAVLCHLDNPFKALSNICDVMEDEGIFILTTPIIISDPDSKRALAEFQLINQGTFMWPNLAGGKHLLHHAGFKTVYTAGTFTMIENPSKFTYLNGVWVAIKNKPEENMLGGWR